MEGILKYDLTDTDDNMAHLRAVKSLDLTLCLWDIQQYLRKLVKYEEDTPSVEELQNFFIETLEKYNININELCN